LKKRLTLSSWKDRLTVIADKNEDEEIMGENKR